jgi:hypothetical protein
MTLDEAERLADQHKFEEALIAIKFLSLAELLAPSTSRLQLRCYTALCRWDAGSDLAADLAQRREPDRICAAAFYHALAVAHLQDGDLADARKVACMAVDAWKPARMAMFVDTRLAGLF